MNRRIFVFGSNEGGRHGAGAAKHARDHHGAKYGVGWGLQGDSFAIPTKDRYLSILPLETIRAYVGAFTLFAAAHPELDFDVSRVGCRLAGYKDWQIAPLFRYCGDNCYFDPAWHRYVIPATLRPEPTHQAPA